MVRFSILLVALAGCDQVFALSEIPPPPDAPPEIIEYDRCATVPDDGLRYATVDNPNPNATAWSWEEARSACLRRGMDLAVLNDPHEAGFAAIEARPYWVGATYDGKAWAAVDGCPAYPTTKAQPTPTPQCGVMLDSDGILTGVDCAGDLGSGHGPSGALCEAPRPPAGGCGFKPPTDEKYILSPTALTYAEARQYCIDQGGHLVVVDTVEELHFIAAFETEHALPRAWIGATFDRLTWHSETPTCPGLYSWLGGTPAFGVSTDCLTTAVDANPESEDRWFAGMTPTRCNEPDVVALCELGDY